MRNFFKNVRAWQDIDSPPKDIMPVRATQAMAVFLVVPTKSRHPRVISTIPFVIP